MNFRNSHLRRLSRLCAVTLAGLAMSAALAPGATGLGSDPTSHAAASARTEAPPTPAVGATLGDSRANGATLRNGSTQPVDVVLRSTSRGDAGTCQALSLAIRDRASGRIIKTARATTGKPIRIARLLPHQTAQYQAEIRFAARSERADAMSRLNSPQGASCALRFAWSFAPAR